ncbi:MAG: glycine oxidase ThiO [Vulcanimicrobiaceae bacterium]
MRSNLAADVVVIGAGLIGLAVADELARRGLTVRLFEQGEPGKAASWAGAGMLAPYTEEIADERFLALCTHSLERYPAFVADLIERTGVDPHLRTDGIVDVALDEPGLARLQRRVAQLRARGVAAELLDARGARQVEAALGPAVCGAGVVASEGQVDNRRLARALRAACARAGVRIETGAGPVSVDADERRVRGVHAVAGYVAAATVVNATGAWSGHLAGVPDCARVPVLPIKGQMLALALPRNLLRHVTWVPGAYLVPRVDGRLLVGATVEVAGFDVRVTAGGLRSLLDASLAALPALRDLAVSETWAGLRPGTPDGLPYLGATPVAGYVVATGHYRNGILLTPATATFIADVIEGKPPSDAPAFAIDRSAQPTVAPV